MGILVRLHDFRSQANRTVVSPSFSKMAKKRTVTLATAKKPEARDLPSREFRLVFTITVHCFP